MTSNNNNIFPFTYTPDTDTEIELQPIYDPNLPQKLKDAYEVNQTENNTQISPYWVFGPVIILPIIILPLCYYWRNTNTI